MITNPRRVAAPSSSTEAQRILSALLAFPGIQLLPSPARVVREWMELLRRRPVTGASIFDLQIIATMKANDVHRIYTFNTGDSDSFEELTVVEPQPNAA